MIKNKNFLIAIILPIFGIYTQNTYAASDDECAIWLCSPAGFPAGCAAAHAAMINRIKNFKPIFPSLSSCKDENDYVPDDIGSYDGKATLIKAHNICTKWGGGRESRCIQNITIPTHYIKDTLCRNNGSSKDGGSYYLPEHCTTNVYYAEVHDKETGYKIGKTYFIGLQGQDVKYYPTTTSKDYSSLYQTGNYKKYIEVIENDYQNGINFDNEYK